MAAVVMVMEEGKDHGGGFALDERGGGFALDERAPPCHIFPRTKMPLDISTFEYFHPRTFEYYVCMRR